MYEVDGKLVFMGNNIINKARLWNTEMFRNSLVYDKKITHGLIILCVGKEAIIAERISEKVMKFVKGKNVGQTL